MKKGLVLWQSKYGAAEKYAGWLQEETGFACLEARTAPLSEAADCEAIVLCGGVYASGIAGLSFLKKNIGKLQGKKLAVFAVGASPCDENGIKPLRERNLTGALADIPLFYGRGAWDESKMTFGDRTLCRMLQKSLQKKSPDTYEPWEEALLSAAGQTCDWTDRRYLAPLTAYLNA